MSAHYVYRVFDHAGRLIYVGSTANLFQRLKSHRSKWWAPQARKVVAKVHPDRRTALNAELKAIKDEQPRWNVQGRTPGDSCFRGLFHKPFPIEYGPLNGDICYAGWNV